jgi:hypothetical protein
MYKVYHSRKHKLQLQAIRFNLATSQQPQSLIQPHSLRDWTLRERLPLQLSSAEQVRDVLHNAPEASFLRFRVAIAHRHRRLEVARWHASLALADVYLLTMCTENKLETHDLDIPLSTSLNTQTGNTESMRHLRVLLMAPSGTLESNLANTLDRIHRFASLTGGQDLAIVFLLHPPKTSSFISVKELTSTSSDPEAGTKGVLAYAKLQASLLPRSDIPHIPILPLASLEGLPALLTKYVTGLSLAPQRVPASTSPFEMLQLSTTESPMDRQTAYFATDCFTSLRDLAVTCTEPAVELTSSSPSFGPDRRVASQSGFARYHGHLGHAHQGHDAEERLRQLCDFVGEQRYAELVEFWLEEWTVD